MMTTRRSFVVQTAVGVLGLGLSAKALADSSPQLTPDSGFPRKKCNFHVGIAGYSFHKFKLEPALEMMKKIDVNYLCIKDFHLPLDSTPEQIKAFHAKCRSYGVTGYAVGPIYMRSKKEIDKSFDYASRVGVNLIVGVPNHDLLPYVEKKVQEYDMRYAIHNHGPDMPKLYPDADDVWSYIKDLDPRIGFCLDIGHDQRNGKDPIIDIQKFHKRIYDIHIKDITANTKAGKRTEIGRPNGKINWPALIRLLRQVNYQGVCSLEHEKDMNDPFLGMAESIGYFKAVMDLA